MKDAGIALNRFRNDPTFKQGLEAGGRLLVQGSLVVGRNDGSVSEAASNESDLDSSDIQENALEEWASSNGCWYNNPQQYYSESGYRFYGFGGEAQVYAEGDRYVHKICRTGQYESLRFFFDRIIIHNTICPEAALIVEGYGRDSLGNFVVLLKQLFFRQARSMSENEVSLYMRCMGFRVISDPSYSRIRFVSDSVIAEDLHSGNIWMTAEGNVVIVDGFFAFNTMY